jgi:hypothetical protein
VLRVKRCGRSPSFYLIVKGTVVDIEEKLVVAAIFNDIIYLAVRKIGRYDIDLAQSFVDPVTVQPVPERTDNTQVKQVVVGRDPIGCPGDEKQIIFMDG